MAGRQGPIFDRTLDAPPPNPLFPTNQDQATGMANVPGATDGLAAGISGAANAMQNYRDVAVGKLARIHAMIDAGQLPQSALSDPSIQPLFHQAGLDQEGHMALLPKISDEQVQLEHATRQLPEYQAGTAGGSMLAGVPTEQAANAQTSGNESSRAPAVAKILSKTPTEVQASNALTAGDVTSRSDVMSATAGYTSAKQEVQLAEDAVNRYDAEGKNADPVFKNALQAAYSKVLPYYIEVMKQNIAMSGLSSQRQMAANDLLLKDFEKRASDSYNEQLRTWVEDRQKHEEAYMSSQSNLDIKQEAKDTNLKNEMNDYLTKNPRPSLDTIYRDMMSRQSDLLGIPEHAAAAARANIAGFTPDAGSLRPNEQRVVDNITHQLKYARTFSIPAPPGATEIDTSQNPPRRVPVDPKRMLTGTAEQLMNSNDSWVTPAIKAYIARFLKQGDPMLVNNPNNSSAGGGHGSTPLNRGGVGQGAQPTTQKKAALPEVQ